MRLRRRRKGEKAGRRKISKKSRSPEDRSPVITISGEAKGISGDTKGISVVAGLVPATSRRGK
jgi:hypothetical protein